MAGGIPYEIIFADSKIPFKQCSKDGRGIMPTCIWFTCSFFILDVHVKIGMPKIISKYEEFRKELCIY